MDKNITIYSFYNNKGGVGKTTLSCNISAMYAKKHPNTQVLVIDMCPQANISQFLLGGGNLGYEKNQRLQSMATRRNVVGFIDWLLKGNDNFKSTKASYKENVSKYNKNISSNLYLIAGDSFLESLSLALNYAVINPANMNAWKNFMTAIRRLCEQEFNKDTEKQYDNMTVFIDCNPSFSIYTQMALVSSDKLIIPMMADFSSVEGIKGIMMLLYDEYPSAALKTYAENITTFSKQVTRFQLKLPVIDRFIFNNFTTNLGIATAYQSVKNDLVKFCFNQYKSFPQYFCKTDDINDMNKWISRYVFDVKDFHTAGKVSSSLGIPISELKKQYKYVMPDGNEVKLPLSNYEKAVDDMENVVNKIA